MKLWLRAIIMRVWSVGMRFLMVCEFGRFRVVLKGTVLAALLLRQWRLLTLMTPEMLGREVEVWIPRVLLGTR